MRHKKADIRRLVGEYMAEAGYVPADYHWKHGANLVIVLPGELEEERRTLRIALRAGISTRALRRKLAGIPPAPAMYRPGHQIDLEELIAASVRLGLPRAQPIGGTHA